MAPKPSYAELQRRISSLETEISTRDVEIENLRKNSADMELESPRHPANSNGTYHKTQKDLEKSRQLIQSLLDTIQGEAFIKDEKGAYIYVNKAYGNDFGVDPEEVIGKDDYFVFSAETAKMLQENDRRIMTAKKPENIEESTNLNGVVATYITNKVPFFDDDGNVLGICGVGFDITHQKKMERAVAALAYVVNECADDLDQHCSAVEAGEGRLLECIEKNDKKVSSRCKDTLKEVGLKE